MPEFLFYSFLFMKSMYLSLLQSIIIFIILFINTAKQKGNAMIQTLYQIPCYDEALIYNAVCKFMEELHIEKELKPESKIVIKPNLVMASNPKAPITTHPFVIKAVVRWLRERNFKNITLAESSGGPYTSPIMKNIYRVCEMNTLEPDLKLNDDFSAKTVPCPKGFQNHSFHLITPITESDYIINICKLKTHAMTGYSGGIKNLFGTIPGLEKPQMHYRWPEIEKFSNMLLELAQTVNPQLTIIDAIDAMEGNGPTGGTSHPMHLLLAAKDMYTQDWFAAKLMGINPDHIVMLRQAREKGLLHSDQINFCGDEIPEDLTPFVMPDTKRIDFASSVPSFLQKPVTFLLRKILKSYPQLDQNKCIGCGKCAESCPQHIIKIKNGKAHFQKKGCISCFCCQEMCPMKAISVKKAL